VDGGLDQQSTVFICRWTKRKAHASTGKQQAIRCGLPKGRAAWELRSISPSSFQLTTVRQAEVVPAGGNL